MKAATYMVLINLFFSACKETEFTPREGDLIFCVAGPSALSHAIVEATATENTLQYDHVAMFTIHEGKPAVIEASAKHGVAYTSWSDFLAQAPKIGGKPGVVVMRLQTSTDRATAVRRAEKYLGMPYDWSYQPDNDKWYCSELVYECYLDDAGEPVFSAAPMNFRDADGNMPEFWKELFGRLGEPIPEGVPGTNPNDLSKDPQLKVVYRFFGLE